MYGVGDGPLCGRARAPWCVCPLISLSLDEAPPATLGVDLLETLLFLPLQSPRRGNARQFHFRPVGRETKTSEWGSGKRFGALWVGGREVYCNGRKVRRTRTLMMTHIDARNSATTMAMKP